jgi:hypothetical protein
VNIFMDFRKEPEGLPQKNEEPIQIEAEDVVEKEVVPLPPARESAEPTPEEIEKAAQWLEK